MTTTTPREAPVVEQKSPSLREVLRARVELLRSGDVGTLPVIVGIIAITIFFTSKSSIFFSAINFENLVVQMAGTTTIAIGVVFVLLLGEIDLSVAYLSGVAGVLVAELQLPGSWHDVPGLIAIAITIAVGAAIGALQGSWVAFFGVPSFVVTLAGYLAWQGVILQVLGTQGVITIQDQQINDVAVYFFPKSWGWAMAAIFSIAYLAAAIGGYINRRRAGLASENLIVTIVRVVFWCALAFVVVGVCNRARGVPLAGLIVISLVVFWSYIAGRTTFGRHVYAVGGNAEAARRAGINVRLIRILVFSISGAMSAVGGIILAARLNSVDLTAGGGSLLLDAIAAAVIGGTSLFGGRGYVKSALYGGLIIAMIGNGLDLLGYSDAIKDMVTAAILLAAVTIDSVSRRRLAASGR